MSIVTTTNEKLKTLGSRHPYARYYVLIVCISLLFNWFIQLAYFLYRTHINPHAFAGERTLLDYTTGVIGDVVIVPLINVTILYIALHTPVRLSRKLVLWIAGSSLLIDIATHFFQGYLRLTNWSMPKPFEWDFVSYWHMISYFFQMSFIVLFLYLVAQGAFRRGAGILHATRAVFALMATFVVLFVWDYLPLHSWSSQVVALIHSFIR